MLKRRFLFPKNSFLFFLYFSFLPFNLPAVSVNPASEIFFKALKLSDSGRMKEDTSKKVIGLLRQSSISSPEPVRSQARLALLELLFKEGDFTSVAVLGETFLQSSPDSEKTALILARALYEKREYSNLKVLFDRIEYRNNYDLFLYALLTDTVLQDESWENLLDAYILTVPASTGDKKRFIPLWLEIKKHGLYNKLSSRKKELLSFKVHFEQKKYHTSVQDAVSFLDEENNSAASYTLLSTEIIDEIVKTASITGYSAKVLTLFKRILTSGGIDKHSLEIKARLYWAVGYLTGKQGFPAKASGIYEEGLKFARNSFYDKMLWYWYAAVVRTSTGGALENLDALTSRWHNPDYFTDILSDLTTTLMRRKRWQDVARLLEKLMGKAGGDIISRLSYVTARAADEGYLSAGEDQIIRWYELSRDSARGVGSGLYYKIMSLAALTNRGFNVSGKSSVFFNDLDSENSAPGRFDELLYGAVIFGLSDYGKELLSIYPDSFSFDSVRAFAMFLNKEGDYLDSIRLMSRYAARNDYRVTSSDIKILYPDAYRKEIKDTAEKENLPVPVFTALIREESHFSSEITSSAGAVGLSQLMPSTARDVAERMRLKAHDLTDPEVNLTLGGWYLQNLIARTDTVSQALFAYNGGLTRVRRWKNEFSSLPEDLFLEVIPYKETSLYGRKVLVSAAVYGYFYYTLPFEMVVKMIFSDIFKQKRRSGS